MPSPHGAWHCSTRNWASPTGHTSMGPGCFLPDAERQHMHRLRLDSTSLGPEVEITQTPPHSQPASCPPTPHRNRKVVLVALHLATWRQDPPTNVPGPREQLPGLRSVQFLITRSHHPGGRGSTLLSCGDVESNPGPVTGNPRRLKAKP